MYVCLCLGITDGDARAAIHAGATTVGGILRSCGSERACGGCSPTIRELIANASDSTSLQGSGGVGDMDRYRGTR